MKKSEENYKTSIFFNVILKFCNKHPLGAAGHLIHVTLPSSHVNKHGNPKEISLILGRHSLKWSVPLQII